MKKPIPLFGKGVKSGYSAVTASERYNCYLESRDDGDKTTLVCLGTPGFVQFIDFGDEPIRGMYPFGDYLYVVHRGTFYQVNNAGVKTPLGTLTTTENKVCITSNGFDIAVTDGSTNVYVYDMTADAVVTISNASPAVITLVDHGLVANTAIRFSTTGTLPTGLSTGTTYYVKTVLTADTFTVSATSGGAAINTSSAGSGIHTLYTYMQTIALTFEAGTCCNLDGYIIVNRVNTGQFYLSGLYDALTWNVLDYATAESNPDNLTRVFSDHSQLLLLGQFTTENQANVGASDFPFSRVGLSIDWGIVGAYSIAKIDNSVAFLARKRGGGDVQVVMYTGGAPKRISTSDVERIINATPTLDAATAFGYSLNGHPFYMLNIGSGDTARTLMYDLSTDCWSYLKSYGINRYRGEISESFINKTLISDYENGKLYRLDNDVYDENGDILLMRVVGKHIFNATDRITINEIVADIEKGVGTESGQGENPMMGMRISKNGGNSFFPTDSYRYQSMGKIGEYSTQLRWGQWGQARDIVIDVAISDPVKRCIVGLWADVELDSD